MAADLVVDLAAEVVAEEAEEAEEVDLVAEVVAEDLEVRRCKHPSSKGHSQKLRAYGL